MNKISNAFLALTIIAMSSYSFAMVSDEMPCEKVRRDFEQYGRWNRACGPMPGADFNEELRRDCETTVKAIKASDGSWNSEHGWASDWQCDYQDYYAEQ